MERCDEIGGASFANIDGLDVAAGRWADLPAAAQDVTDNVEDRGRELAGAEIPRESGNHVVGLAGGEERDAGSVTKEAEVAEVGHLVHRRIP